MKAKRCVLILHGSCKEINIGEFPSISSAKKWVSDVCWNKPFTIKEIKS